MKLSQDAKQYNTVLSPFLPSSMTKIKKGRDEKRNEKSQASENKNMACT